jgi:hypothetical protein
MTIDSGWTKIIKEGVPQAFTAEMPGKPYTVFIDGQINLMKADYIKTWKLFLEKQFTEKIRAAFALGARVVVLAFDNYKHVPTAKNMTQLKRNRHVPVLDFGELDDLPPLPPENWAGAMRNRTFKSKVAAFVTQNMRIIFQDMLHTTLLIDFKDKVEHVGAFYELPPVLADATARRGECDVKAFTFLSDDGPLLIQSTDGDFIPLALLQMQLHHAKDKALPQVFLYRMRTTLDKDKKRPAEGSSKREYEYVCMTRVLNWVQAELGFLENPVDAFAALVATTGCDFCMNLPNIGPKSIWMVRHAFTALDLRQPQDLLVAISRTYHQQHKARLAIGQPARVNPPGPGEDLLTTLASAGAQYDLLSGAIRRCSRIAQRTRDSIWTEARMLAHVKNTLWTVQYWTRIHYFQDPSSADFGYIHERGRCNFAGVNTDA